MARMNKTSPWKERVQAERRASAEERNARYNALSIEEKLQRLDRANLVATRERARLNAALQSKMEKAK